MINFYQETNSKVVFPLPDKLRVSLSDPEKGSTTGGREPFSFQRSTTSPLVAQAWHSIRQVQDPEMAKAALSIVGIFSKMVDFLQAVGFDIGHLPPLRAFEVEDGALLVEWIFEEFRIGFSFEPELNESGWYLVTTKTLGEIGASGYLSGIDIDNLILWLLNFALSNS